jgi:hypothetical protein
VVTRNSEFFIMYGGYLICFSILLNVLYCIELIDYFVIYYDVMMSAALADFHIILFFLFFSPSIFTCNFTRHHEIYILSQGVVSSSKVFSESI